MSRQFELGDVLSITTDMLISPRHIEGIYDILDYMTGDNLMTHQLPRAGRECAPELLRQHPQLGNVDASTVTPDNWREWLAEQVKVYGAFLPVEPLAHYTPINPMLELTRMVDASKIVVIDISRDEASHD